MQTTACHLKQYPLCDSSPARRVFRIAVGKGALLAVLHLTSLGCESASRELSPEGRLKVVLDHCLGVETRTAPEAFPPPYVCGMGTEESPYLIVHEKQLMALGRDLASARIYYASYFHLIYDLDMTGQTMEPIGDLANPFQGRGHTISNLKMNFERSAGQDDVGLFGVVNTVGAAIAELKCKTYRHFAH